MNNQKLKQSNSSQSEPEPTKARPWMDGVWTGHFFSLGSFSPANLPTAESSRSVPRVQNLGFIQMDGLKTENQGWFVCGCSVTLASNSMEEADRGVNFEWVWWESQRLLTALPVSEPKTSVGRVFDFCNTCWFWAFENFQNQRTASSRYLNKKPDSNNCWFWVF
jgi:hypothetical protein